MVSCRAGRIALPVIARQYPAVPITHKHNTAEEHTRHISGEARAEEGQKLQNNKFRYETESGARVRAGSAPVLLGRGEEHRPLSAPCAKY